jgi:hypothetical protein
MRDNSGSGKGKNNMRDPTMRDHEGEDREAKQEGRDFTEGAAFDFGKDRTERDEKRSPSDRTRGETASTERAPPVDTSRR